jgi:hypothetical protein
MGIRFCKTSVTEKRDDTSDADNSDWVEIPGWSSFLLHVDTCSRISTADEGMDVTKRDSSISESTQSYFAQILDDVLAIVSFLDRRQIWNWDFGSTNTINRIQARSILLPQLNQPGTLCSKMKTFRPRRRHRSISTWLCMVLSRKTTTLEWLEPLSKSRN